MTRVSIFRGDAATHEAPMPRSQWTRRLFPIRWWLDWPSPWDAAVAFVGGILVFVLGFGGGRSRLSSPLGGGDLLPAYEAARLWSAGTPFGNASLGYPFGVELRYYPTTDFIQNGAAGLITALTGNPFLGMNAVFAMSFPLTALAAFWVIRIAGVRGPMAIFLSLAFTTIPYHWYRLDHVYLGTVYSAVLGVGLALLVGTGRIERGLAGERRGRAIAQIAGLAVVIAASGIYYACFTIMVCAVAALYRLARGAQVGRVALALAPAVVVAVATASALAPAMLFVRSHPALVPVAERIAIESVAYSGVLAFTLLPAPISRLPGASPINDAVAAMFGNANSYGTAGVLWYADFGSLFTTLAIVFSLIGAVAVGRRRARSGRTPTATDGESVAGDAVGERVTFGLVGILLVVTVLFFVPWGLNFLFAYTVTPQLRGWDRLVPMMFMLVFAGAAVAWRSLRFPQAGTKALGIAGICFVLLVFDSVAPYRSYYAAASANGSVYGSAGYVYAASLNAAIPERCAVLQLPYVGYPEEPPTVALGSYAPLWPALTNPDKLWSYGAMKGTVASAWQEGLSSNIGPAELEKLRRGGFCAVHVDRAGYTEADAQRLLANLARLMGQPVAVGFDGAWTAFRIPGAVVGGFDVARLDEMSAGDAVFYAPPRVVAADASGVVLERDSARSWRWLGLGTTSFRVTSIAEGAEFRSVRGTVLAAECSAEVAVVTLRSDAEQSSIRLVLVPGEERDFSLSLVRKAADATLSVEAEGVSCVTAADGRPRAVALVNPVFGP